MEEQILLVEAELDLQETLVNHLERQGYAVTALGDGLEALNYARQHHPHLVLLDAALPGMDGIEVCRTLRAEMDTPVLILMIQVDAIERATGLDTGAVDFISKPFSMRALVSRVKSRLRTARLVDPPSTSADLGRSLPEMLVFGDLLIDLRRRELRRDDRLLAAKPREFDLLAYLAQHQGTALSRQTVLERVWGWDYIGDSRTVDVHVRWLREKIEIDPADPRRIITVRGVGYRFDG